MLLKCVHQIEPELVTFRLVLHQQFLLILEGEGHVFVVVLDLGADGENLALVPVASDLYSVLFVIGDLLVEIAADACRKSIEFLSQGD